MIVKQKYNLSFQENESYEDVRKKVILLREKPYEKIISKKKPSLH